jgi:MYXO-CTERM domain-containing protein
VYDWSLHSDNAGTLGGSLFGTYQVNVLSPGMAELNYAALISAGSPLMQSNTTYWLTLRFSHVVGSVILGQYAELPVTTSTATTGTGSLGALMENTGSGWTGLSEKAVLQVQVESVPEPGSGALVALGLAGLTAMRRRRSC